MLKSPVKVPLHQTMMKLLKAYIHHSIFTPTTITFHSLVLLFCLIVIFFKNLNLFCFVFVYYLSITLIMFMYVCYLVNYYGGIVKTSIIVWNLLRKRGFCQSLRQGFKGMSDMVKGLNGVVIRYKYFITYKFCLILWSSHRDLDLLHF